MVNEFGSFELKTNAGKNISKDIVQIEFSSPIHNSCCYPQQTATNKLPFISPGRNNTVNITP